MLRVTASRQIGSGETLEMTVELNDYDRLTPRAARAALQIAFGGRDGGTVWLWEEGYGYRVYPNSTRKLHWRG